MAQNDPKDPASKLSALIEHYRRGKDHWSKAYEELAASNVQADELIAQIQRIRKAAPDLMLLCNELEDSIRRDAVERAQEWDLLSQQLADLLTEINSQYQGDLGGLSP
jgi:hypothetical protein